MKDIIFKGCGTAICTPFSENGEINYEVFEKFIEFQINNKIDAIIVCGTTGESSTMTEQERKDSSLRHVPARCVFQTARRQSHAGICQRNHNHSGSGGTQHRL